MTAKSLLNRLHSSLLNHHPKLVRQKTPYSNTKGWEWFQNNERFLSYFQSGLLALVPYSHAPNNKRMSRCRVSSFRQRTSKETNPKKMLRIQNVSQYGRISFQKGMDAVV